VPDVSLRVLNRTLLDRQFLLSRDPRPTLGVIERLVALQSQEPNWPYVGLWAKESERLLEFVAPDTEVGELSIAGL